MQIGTVIVYRERNRLALGVINKEPSTTTKGKTQVEILGEDGKKSILVPDRIFLDCRHTLSPTQPLEELKKSFRKLRSQIDAQTQTVDLKELWDLLEEEETDTFEWPELAGFLASADEPLAMASVLDVLWRESVYFKEKQVGVFVRRDSKNVEELLHQQERERIRLQTQGEFIAWVQAQQAAPGTVPAPEGMERFLDLLKGLALYGDNYEKKQSALKLLDEIDFRTKGHPWDVAFQLLVGLGIWDANEELSILRYQIPTRFPDEVIQAAAETPNFPQNAPDVPPGYTDLRSLLTFTIDDADTTEIDDALSLSEENGQPLIGVHITDTSFFIPPDGVIDRAGLLRGTTVYLPGGKLPMLPSALSEDKASLVAGVDRPSLSFFASLNETGRLQVERICQSIIRVGRRLSYQEADHLLADAEADACTHALQQLNSLAQLRKAQRIANGAVIIEGAEIKVRVTDSDIHVSVLSNDSPSRSLVGECMILANEIAARYCLQHGVPALYIGQPPPDEAVPQADQLPTQQVYIHAARRLMKPSKMGIQPASHSALGLDAYTQVTSPLRRYHDLQIHRQIKHHLAHGEALFDEERLQVLAASAQESSGASRRCERESTRYWLLRLLETQQGQQVSGQVVREQYGRSFIELNDTLLVVSVNTGGGLPLGSPVQVVIGHVDARRDILSVRVVS